MARLAASRRGAPALACAAGAAAVAAYSLIPAAPLALGAIALLSWLWLHAGSPRRAAWLGFAFGLGHFGAGVSWVFVSLHRFGGMSAPLAALATAAFVAYLALFPALVGSLQARLGIGAPLRLLALIPALWTLAEWLRSWLLTGFPWLALGYSQIDTPLAGYAPPGGVFAVTLAAAALSGAAVLIARGGRGERTLAALVAVALLGAGAWLRAIDWTEPAGEPVPVALVQGNVPQSLKFDPRHYLRTLDTYRRLVLSTDARLVVLPETAIPRFLETIDADWIETLARHARARGGDVLLGVPLREPDGRLTNSVVTLGAAPAQRYAKSHLVPLGEFVPGEFAWIVRLLRIPLADFSPGTVRPEPLAAGGARVAVNICYEDAFGDEIARQLPQATLLANVSNVAWFGDSLAPEQHLQISRMRAIETGRAMLRATNTGVTALIDRRGEVIARLPGFTEGVLSARAPQYAGATPYVRTGDASALALAAVLALGCLGAALSARKAR